MRRNATPLASIVLLTLVAFLSVNSAAEATDSSTPEATSAALAIATVAPADAVATQRPTFTPTAAATSTSTPTPPPTIAPTVTATPTVVPTVLPLPTETLPPDGQTGKAIIIDQTLQMMYVYEDEELVRAMPVSTGKPTDSTFTPAWQGYVGHYVGTFTSFGTTQDEGWYLFKSDGGILIHGNPYNIVDGAKVYVELEALGNYPASHGCIRLSPEDALWFTEWEPRGAYCVITAMPDEAFE